MAVQRFPLWTFACAGGVAYLLLHLHFLIAWQSLYGQYEYLDSEITRQSIPPALFANSQRSLLVAVIAFAVLPLITLWFRDGRRRIALLALWSGVILAMLLTIDWDGGGALWSISLFSYLFLTGTPLLAGALLQAGIEDGIKYVRKRSRPDAPERVA